MASVSPTSKPVAGFLGSENPFMITKQQAGKVLIIMGVLAWAPFAILSIAGAKPPILPFLAVHLTGVIGGSQLRRMGRPDGTKRKRRQRLGHILIFLGVLAWVPYFYQKQVLDTAIEVGPYLAVHLSGVLSGIALLASVPLGKYLAKRRSEKLVEESLPG